MAQDFHTIPYLKKLGSYNSNGASLSVFRWVTDSGIEPEFQRGNAVRDKIDRYGLWAVAFSVIAPPPYPMKLFILSAGVFGMPFGKFALAAVLGRTVRYSMVGYLAVRYGEKATELLRDHFAWVAVGLAAMIAIGLIAQALRQRTPT